MKLLSNKFFIIGNVILLLVAIPVTLFFIKKQQDLRSQATAASKLYFEPASPNTSTQCQSFNVDIMIDPSSNLVSIVDFYFTYDPTKVDVSQITPSDNFKTVVRASTITSGTANMSLSVGADVTKAVSTVSKVATVTFVPKGAGNFQASFDTAKTRVFSLGPSDQPTENVLSSTSPANITIGTAACLDGATGSVTPSVSPGAGTPTTTPSVTVSPGAGTPTTTPGTGGANTSPICSSLTVNPSATGSAPFAVLFTGTGNDPDATGLISKASFTFGDGQTRDVTTGLNQKSANVQANYTYQTAGNYAASLVFTDNAGAISSTCLQNITVRGASVSATPSTVIPTATPTLVQKPTTAATSAPAPTISPPGDFVQTMGTLSLIVVALIGGFVLLAL